MSRYAPYHKFFTHPHWKRESRLLVTLRVPQFISIEAKLDACAGYVDYLFQGDERKVRTEGHSCCVSWQRSNQQGITGERVCACRNMRALLEGDTNVREHLF